MSILTDTLYDLYLQQIAQTRNELLAHAGLNGNSGPTYVDQATADYYLKVKALGLLFIGAEKVQQIFADKAVKKTYSSLTEQTLKQQEISKLTQEEKDNNIEKTYSDLTTSTNQITSNLESQKEILNQQIQEYYNDLEDYKIEQFKEAGYGDPNEVGEAARKYFESNNINNFKGGVTGVSTLPKPGEEVLGHDTGLGEAISNQLSFSVDSTPTQKGQKYYKAWASVPKGTINQTGTPKAPLTERLNKMLEQIRKTTPGSYRFFIEKLHGKAYDGTFFKKNPIKPGATPIEMPNRMVFPAYITAFNDSYDSAWSEYKFIGRGEPVFVWEQTTRSLTLEFYIISDFSADLLLAAIDASRKETQKGNQSNNFNIGDKLNKTTHTLNKNWVDQIKDKAENALDKLSLDDEEKLKELKRIFPDWGNGTTPDPSFIRGQKSGFIPGQISGTPEQLYERLTFLSQCLYGWYRKDGKLKEQPFVRVRIGDFFDVICKINSLQITADELDLDLNPSVVGEIPTAARVSINMSIIHEDEPTSEYRRFYHRRDYDKEDINFVPESGKPTSQYKDGAMDHNDTKSPISNTNPLSSYGESAMQFPKAAVAQQIALNNFDSSLKDLTTTGANLNDIRKRETLKTALSNAKRLLEITQTLDLQQVESPKETVKNVVMGNDTPITTTSLADTPISKTFEKAQVEKTNRGRLLFPKFKSLNINQEGPKQ